MLAFYLKPIDFNYAACSVCTDNSDRIKRVGSTTRLLQIALVALFHIGVSFSHFFFWDSFFPDQMRDNRFQKT